MDMDFIKVLVINLAVWVACGLLIWVPLTNLLNSYLKHPQRASYKMGVFWGIGAGSLFTVFNYYHLSFVQVGILCGTLIIAFFVYRNLIKNN